MLFSSSPRFCGEVPPDGNLQPFVEGTAGQRSPEDHDEAAQPCPATTVELLLSTDRRLDILIKAVGDLARLIEERILRLPSDLASQTRMSGNAVPVCDNGKSGGRISDVSVGEAQMPTRPALVTADTLIKVLTGLIANPNRVGPVAHCAYAILNSRCLRVPVKQATSTMVDFAEKYCGVLASAQHEASNRMKSRNKYPLSETTAGALLAALTLRSNADTALDFLRGTLFTTAGSDLRRELRCGSIILGRSLRQHTADVKFSRSPDTLVQLRVVHAHISLWNAEVQKTVSPNRFHPATDALILDESVDQLPEILAR